VEICAIRRASLKACATPMRRFTRRSRLRRMPGKWTAQQWKRCWARSRNSNRPFINSFIYPSGCGVLGNTGDKVADEDTPLAPTPLVAWRPANERLVLEAARQGVQGVVLRPAKVYARGGGLVASFTQSAREQGAARMIGDGENRWTFVHLDDLAASRAAG
jgi:NAD dependent epimerase/dehydratase family enzyme